MDLYPGPCSSLNPVLVVCSTSFPKVSPSPLPQGDHELSSDELDYTNKYKAQSSRQACRLELFSVVPQS